MPRRYPRIPGFEPVDAVDVVDYRPIFDRGPQVVGGYQLGQRLGTGTLGPCYEAWHLGRREPVVVKLLTIDEVAHDRLLAERALLQNLQSLASLNHPGLVRLREAGPTDNGIFIAVEPAPGRTLDAALASGWRPADAEAVALASGIASTLTRAHGAGMVHGNLHGANVVLDDEHRPRLADFGLLGAARHRAVVDEEGQRLAHRVCRAPELDQGAQQSIAGDTYALGVLLVRLSVDEVSFNEMAACNWNTRGWGTGWAALAELRPDLPAALCAWVAQALDPDPARRPDLADGLPQQPALQVPLRTAALSPRASKPAAGPWPRRAAALGLVVLVGAGALGVARSVLDKSSSTPVVETADTRAQTFENAAGTSLDPGRPQRRTDMPEGREKKRPSLRLDR